MKLQFLSKCKSICGKSVPNNLDGLNVESLFGTFQSQRGLKQKSELFKTNVIEVSTK